MPCTNLFAKIKKIDITNKVYGDKWNQAITITLSDIELNDENLIAIRKFRPSEEVKVNLKSLQLSIDEIEEREKLKKLYPKEGVLNSTKPKENSSQKQNTNRQNHDTEDLSLEPEDEEELFHIEYDDELTENDTVLKTFNFSET